MRNKFYGQSDAHFYNKSADRENVLIQRIGKWLAERDGRHIPTSSWQLNPYHDAYLEEAGEFLIKFGTELVKLPAGARKLEQMS